MDLVNGTHAYCTAFFEPSKYNLTQTEIKTMLAQIPALRAIDNLYILQKSGVNGLKIWKGVNSILRVYGYDTGGQGGVIHTNYSTELLNYRNAFSIYGAPWDSKGNKIKLEFTEEDWKRFSDEISKHGNVQVDLKEIFQLIKNPGKPKKAYEVFINDTGLSDEEFEEKMSKLFEEEIKRLTDLEKSARQNPFLRIDSRIIVKGKEIPMLIETPYYEVPEWAPYVKEAAEALWKASRIIKSEYPIYSLILSSTAESMITGNTDLRDALIAQNDSRLFTLAGVCEDYIGMMQGWTFVKKGAYEMFLGVKDPETTQLIQKAKDKLPEMLKEIPTDLRNDSIPNININAYVHAWIAGEANHMGAQILAVNWPNKNTINNVFPTIILNVNEHTLKAKHVFLPMVREGLIEDQFEKNISYETLPKAWLTQTIIHEISHSIGRAKVRDNRAEEGKAIAGSLFNMKHVAEKEVMNNAIYSFPVELIRAIRRRVDKNGKVNGSHEIASNAILEYCYASGALDVENSKFVIKSPNELVNAVGNFYIDVLNLAQESQSEIDKFFDKYSSISEKTKGVIQTLNNANIPLDIFIDRGSLDELEYWLREALESSPNR